MTMKRISFILATVLIIAGCGRQRLTKEEVIDYGEIGLSDIVSYIVVGYQENWEGMDPAEEMKLSSVYRYSSPYCGFAQKDINGDGIPELLIGDKFEDGTTVIYDIYTIHPRTASLVHLASGGERDRYTVNESGTIIEEGSNSASDSFTKVYRIKKGKLVESKTMTLGNCPMELEMQTFESLARKSGQQLCGGYTDVREPSDEEYQLFRAVTDSMEGMSFTPLTVQTQVVAGINYRFYCRFSDGSEEYSPGHCWLTIYKPLPGQGEPKVTSLEKIQ